MLLHLAIYQWAHTRTSLESALWEKSPKIDLAFRAVIEPHKLINSVAYRAYVDGPIVRVTMRAAPHQFVYGHSEH